MELVFADFLEWMREQPEAKPFLANSSCHCPLACFLAEKTSRPYWVAGSAYGIGDVETQTPSWAENFVRKVDRYLDFVTREQCLSILSDLAGLYGG